MRAISNWSDYKNFQNRRSNFSVILDPADIHNAFVFIHFFNYSPEITSVLGEAAPGELVTKTAAPN
jgi:hypothetical protein